MAPKIPRSEGFIRASRRRRAHQLVRTRHPLHPRTLKGEVLAELNGAQHRTAPVTGGTGGIGRATALGLAQMGADVAITGRDASRAEHTDATPT